MAKIIEGDADGVKVELDLKNNRAIITTVNNFDVYWMLSRKNNLNRPYAETIANPALEETPTDAVDAQAFNRNKAYFAVPLRSLTEPYKIEENYSKELGWDNPDVTGLTPERVKQIMAGPQKTQALQRTI